MSRIQTIALPEHRRILAISDIHGHCGLLEGLLEKADWSENDILFIVGDIMPKGPENLRTLRYVMELSKKPNVHVLMGNWEYLYDRYFREYPGNNGGRDLLGHIERMRRRYPVNFWDELFSELGLSVTSGKELTAAMAAASEAFRPEIDFLRSLPHVIFTRRLVFVHGGIPTTDRKALEAMDGHCLLKYDAFLEKGLSFDRYVITGHWPVANYRGDYSCQNPVILRQRRIISIDGGVGIKPDCQLNALIIPHEDSEDFSFCFQEDFPLAVAMEDQQESADSIHIRWVADSRIVPVREEGDCVLAEHAGTGRRMWIPRDRVWEQDGGSHAEFSDYSPYIRKNDILSVVKETDKGRIVKKDGVTGWYRGALAFL